MNQDGGNQVGSGAGPPGLEIRSWWGRLLVGRRPVRTLIRLIVVVALILPISKWCLVPIRVTGRSMEPTYRSGRINALNLLAYHHAHPQRGDVVGIQLRDHRMVLLKRVLGLPGERVIVRDGVVCVNGQPLAEPYAHGRGIPSMSNEVTLGPTKYLVIGDNRDVSEYGVVDRAEIKGKILF